MVVAVAVSAVNALWDGDPYPPPGALGVLLALAATLPAVAARRHPVEALAVTGAAVLLLTWRDYPRWVAVIGPSLVLIGVIADRSRIFAAGALTFVVVVTLLALREEPSIDGYQVATLTFVGTAALVGLLLRVVERGTKAQGLPPTG